MSSITSSAKMMTLYASITGARSMKVKMLVMAMLKFPGIGAVVRNSITCFRPRIPLPHHHHHHVIATSAVARIQRGRIRRTTAAFSSSSSSSSSSDSIHGHQCRWPNLDLVFDINKTILIDDPAGGKNEYQLLNEIISDVAWGQLRQEDGKWVSANLPLSIDRPKAKGALLSYSSYIHDRYPDVRGQDLKAIKKQRDDLKFFFTSSGQPGQAYVKELEALDAALRLPTAAAGSLSQELINKAGLQGRQYVGILPAFFHLLHRLQQEQEEGGPRFVIHFRSFGSDPPRIVQEFNAFCRGDHPLFPGQTLGTTSSSGLLIDHTVDLGNHAESYGSMYRDAEGTVLILGTFEQPLCREEVARYKRQGYRVLETLQEMHHFIRQRQQGNKPTLAIRDYWPWWRSNLEEASAGKLVMVPCSSTKKALPLPSAEDWHTIVFDDNIERERAHIIDLRCAESGDPIPFVEGLGKGHLVRAEPYLSIRDPEKYFYGCIEECLHKKAKYYSSSSDRDGQLDPLEGAIGA